jgi:hypothetical protein
MSYYIFVEDNKLNGAGQCKCLSENIQNIEVEQSLFDRYLEDVDRYIWNGMSIVDNPQYEEIKKQKERQRLDALTLTPADVERALYKAKGMDFEDLKALIAQNIPNIDIKGLAIEFRAKDFYRGAMANGLRLFDVVGALLGYSPIDMDYLFQHKELPSEVAE